MLLKAIDAARPHLFGQPIDDLDAGQVALVHRAVEGLPGKRLLVDRAVGVAVEKAAEFVFQLVDAFDRPVDQRPCEILVREPCAADDRVHEMPLDRITRRKRDVVATLHHARTAAFAEQALDGDGDRQRRIGGVRVQSSEQPGAAGTENQDVRPMRRRARTRQSEGPDRLTTPGGSEQSERGGCFMREGPPRLTDSAPGGGSEQSERGDVSSSA